MVNEPSVFELLKVYCIERHGVVLNHFYCNKKRNKPEVLIDLMLFNFWLVVLGLTALRDSISVYIGPSPREREKETRKDR